MTSHNEKGTGGPSPSPLRLISKIRFDGFCPTYEKNTDGRQLDRSPGSGIGEYLTALLDDPAFAQRVYSAVIPLLVGMSLWLGSFAGAIVAIVPTVLIGIRAMLEEKFLRRELPGYAEYITRTRFRMIPYVW
jgi:hypothetical protein